jgi:DNA polymerase V
VDKDPLWVKKQLTIRGLVTQYELQGKPSIPLVTEIPLPKSIQVSRTWGSILETYDDVWHAMQENIVKAAGQLREYGLAAGAMSVFLRYGRHGEYGYFTKDLSFRDAILSDIEMVHSLKAAIEAIYRERYEYTQGGVTLMKLSDAIHRQRGLFDQEEYEYRTKLEKLAHAVDIINFDVGTRVVYPASLCVKDKKWRPKRQFLSENAFIVH